MIRDAVRYVGRGSRKRDGADLVAGSRRVVEHGYHFVDGGGVDANSVQDAGSVLDAGGGLPGDVGIVDVRSTLNLGISDEGGCD